VCSPYSGQALRPMRNRIHALHMEVSYLVKARRETVYAAYTDFETWPKWSREETNAKVIGREGDVVTIQSEIISRGKRRMAVAKLATSPPEQVESEGETRFTKWKRLVRFEDAPEGTKVTASLDVFVKRRWAWIFAPRLNEEARTSVLERLKSFSEYVEGLP